MRSRSLSDEVNMQLTNLTRQKRCAIDPPAWKVEREGGAFGKGMSKTSFAIFRCSLLLHVFIVLANPSISSAAQWEFGSEETSPLKASGHVLRDQAGPRPPEFPDMPANNTAIRVDSAAYLSIADEGPDSDFDFTNGDAITMEAWVNPSSLSEGQVAYVIGKGRTGSPKFARDNQNWSLRLVGSKGAARISLLFATQPREAGRQAIEDKKSDAQKDDAPTRKASSDPNAHWHRWDSTNGFPVASGWHHVAISYRFGDPKSIRGWINGKVTDGSWSYGGETRELPIVDDDEIRIGNGFVGLLDSIGVHREALDDRTIAARFRRVGEPRTVEPQPEVMPRITDIPDGRVLVQISAGLPTHDRWLNEGEAWPMESTRWTGDKFLLPRIPLQYDSWGIRSAWDAPVLVRIAGDVELPLGPHRFMLRARALSRLWIDGEVVARTEPVTKRPPDGEEPVIPVAQPPLDGVRLHGYRQQEVFSEFDVAPSTNPSGLQASRRCRVVLEMVVGGKGHRTETGEVCVAMLSADGKTYELLGTNSPMLPLTDAAIEPELAAIEESLSRFDDERRRSAAASQDTFWLSRHDRARSWATTHWSTESPFREQTSHPIDAFVASKIQRAIEASSSVDPHQAKLFHGQVLPILREHCFRCHGEKEKGGLKLDSREAALKAGDSGSPAIVPSDLDGSELITRIRSGDMPPTDDGLPKEQIELLEQWVKSGAAWPAVPLSADEVAFAPIVDDEKFIRRVYLDTVGVPPTEAEVIAFTNGEHFGDSSDGEADVQRRAVEGPAENATQATTRRYDSVKRERLIDNLLDDERFADGWMDFWLDLLAENPSLLNASLNSTGPFRWFLYDSLRDNKPLDRMISELILMRGGAAEGGSAGFGQAAENDAPMAAKGHILASAFLGIELQCARCHDSPYHSTTQKDLYSLAAMLSRKPVTVPKTSQVPTAFFENLTSAGANGGRQSLINVTLSPDQAVAPEWPFADVTGAANGEQIDRLMHDTSDSRERLAALITAPQNLRFSRVIVNRVWKRLIGTGIVEPVHDWEGGTASHPELLDWLAKELITHDYDLRHVVRLILSSETYQREAVGKNLSASASMRLFNAPDRRRLSAEQIVDSMHHATGRPIDAEELTFVHDGRRELGQRQTLGRPTRAWMFGDLKNERDRPSLSLPRARAVVDVLEAFGWTGARQMPIAAREVDPNLLQPGVLANGTLSMSLTRAAYQSDLAQLAVATPSAEALVDSLFRRFLSRKPKPEERRAFTEALAVGFADRLVPADRMVPVTQLPPLPQVTWFNHGRAKANEIQLEIERRVLAGPQPDPRLSANWRATYEAAVWSLINHREFVWMP
ncbi:MAG: DUF1553 domain-containing protein [Pirellulaceae bacterium]